MEMHKCSMLRIALHPFAEGYKIAPGRTIRNEARTLGRIMRLERVRPLKPRLPKKLEVLMFQGFIDG
jgi:hypothetical protein